jgi:hypothetical protein
MSTKIDNATLAKIVDECFMLSTDGGLTPNQREMFGHIAEHLRGQLMILLSKTFDEGTPELAAANKQITAVNAQLKKDAEGLANIADTLEQVSKLVSVVDGLLKIPLGFL